MTKSHKIRAGKGPAGTGPAGTEGSGPAGIGPARNRESSGAKPLVGGVLHDDRGNAIWHWASDTARHAAVSTSALLKRLNVSSLSLEETQDKERRQAAAWASYSAATSTGKDGASGKGAVSGKATAAGKPRVRTSWWRRLFQRR